MAQVEVTDGIWHVTTLLAADECARYIAATEERGYEAATISTRKGDVLALDQRDNGRLIVDDPQLAREVWAQLAPHMPRVLDGQQAIGLNERFRYYRYTPGQSFKGHTDGAFRRSNGEESKLTVLLYLNDDFTGGETAFQTPVAPPRRGAALVFRHELFHEGRPVLSGRKYVMRTDVMFNPLGRFSE
jgi:predicted 2-oxoglutarate/Fe(II)-dependent dioxygenase YbiX